MKSVLRSLAPACAVVALAGCTLGPDFSRPTAPAATAYTRAVPAGATPQSIALGGQVAADWYTLFHSESLNELVRQALAHNPGLEAARHGLLAAQYELQAVAGSALPRIDARGGISRAHINGSFLYEPVGALSVTGNQFSLGPTLAYRLDVFGGVRRSLEAQTAATDQARAEALDTYVTLVDQVVVTAFDYAAAAAQLEVSRALVEDLQRQLELTRALEAAGKVTRADTLQAQTQLENTAATLPALEQQCDVYRNALARLVGRPPDEFQLPPLTLQDFELPESLPLSLPSQLVRQRPDILAAEDSLHQASAAIGVAEAARFPSLTLSGQYAQQGSRLNEVFTRPGGIWSIGTDLSAPIFSAGTLSARAAQAKERYRQALAAYRSTVLAAFVEVADALHAVEHDADSYAAHRRALESAAASRDLALAQYRAGKYNELQVLAAEQQYQNAALSQVQAQAQRFADTAALFRALGGGWWNTPRDPLASAATQESAHD
jgi:NodT family efflux transporter outer membrane factor (OMF) lipoprotein